MKFRQQIFHCLGMTGLLLAVSSLFLSGCTNINRKNLADDRTETETSDTESTRILHYAWPLATASPEDTVTQIFSETFAEEVLRLSDGKLKIQVYPNSTLGGDRDLLESCADGDIPFIVQNTAPQVAFMPNLAVFDLPCVFDSLKDCRETIDQPEFYSLIRDVYTESGYHLLGIADQGFRVMSTNKPITSIEDFKGQKIRTMENRYHLSFWKALNANPTPMNFSEVYIGLQQHTIDAQENPYEVITSNRLYEQQDYIVETNHLPHLITLIVNDEFFHDLSSDEQKIMTEAAQTAVQYAREQADKRIADRIREIEANQTTILTPSAELHRQIQNLSESVYEEIRENISPFLYNTYIRKSN